MRGAARARARRRWLTGRAGWESRPGSTRRLRASWRAAASRSGTRRCGPTTIRWRAASRRWPCSRTPHRPSTWASPCWRSTATSRPTSRPICRGSGIPPERLWLGIGAGFTKRPLTVVREGLAAMRERAARAGPGLVVAAMGPKMCAFAGAEADGVFLNWMTPAKAAWARERVHEGAREAGRAAPPPIFGYVRVAVGAGRRGAAAEGGVLLPRPAPGLHPPLRGARCAARLGRDRRARRERGRPAPRRVRGCDRPRRRARARACRRRVAGRRRRGRRALDAYRRVGPAGGQN